MRIRQVFDCRREFVHQLPVWKLPTEPYVIQLRCLSYWYVFSDGERGSVDGVF